MGITGLLPFLEKATRPCHLSEFRGATVVVDTYCWLHKGATACAIQLVQGEKTTVYIDYCLRLVKMLQSYEIRPILVFDGRNLPAKAGTEEKRRESRNKARQKAAELIKLGKNDEARSYLKASVNISPEMASALIKECHKINVDCIVAPYECDVQLAFFNLKGIAELVITEDSDLVLFGCTKVFYKMDARGCGYLVDAEKICNVMNIRPDRYSFDKFRHMCILSGCDYVDSLPGIGLKMAQKFLVMTDESDPEVFLNKMPQYLKKPNLQITEEYKQKFMIADATFRHQIVFDPFRKKLVPLFDPQVAGTNPKYCVNAGEVYDHAKAYQVALGNLHPSTFNRLDNWDPETANLSNKSIWYDGKYEKSVSRKEQKRQERFKNYFTNTVKLESISEMEDLEIKREEDRILEKELEVYKVRLPEVKKEEKIEVEKEIVTKVEKVSPVIKKNPFIKKLSKFQRTQIDESVIVKSRFFASQVQEKEVQDTSTSEEKTDNQVDISREERSENHTQESIVEDSDTDNCPMIIHFGDLDNENDPPAGKFSELELIETEPDVETISKYFTCSPVKEEPKETGSSVGTKRKFLGSCRSVGLKKSKTQVLQGQKPISSFFKKIEKDTG